MQDRHSDTLSGTPFAQTPFAATHSEPTPPLSTLPAHVEYFRVHSRAVFSYSSLQNGLSGVGW